MYGFNSCKKDTTPLPDMGYNYFPNDVGRYVVYDVDSLVYNDANLNPNTHLAPVDTFRFQIKEKITSVFSDNLNRPTLRLERFVKIYSDTLSYNQMPWKFRNVWTENRTTSTAEKVEENVRYIKLAFPVKENQTWNGNAQNYNQEMNYYYAFYDQRIKVGGVFYDSALQVIQYDDGGGIFTERQLYTEKYARNVGMIYKQEINVFSQPFAGWNNLTYGSDSVITFFAKPLMQRITGGTQCTMTINTYGVE